MQMHISQGPFFVCVLFNFELTNEKLFKGYSFGLMKAVVENDFRYGQRNYELNAQ